MNTDTTIQENIAVEAERYDALYEAIRAQQGKLRVAIGYDRCLTINGIEFTADDDAYLAADSHGYDGGAYFSHFSTDEDADGRIITIQVRYAYTHAWIARIDALQAADDALDSANLRGTAADRAEAEAERYLAASNMDDESEACDWSEATVVWVGIE